MEVLRVENFSYSYSDRDYEAIKNIDLAINKGELVLVVGPSGCGKSTLLRALNRNIPDFSGGTVNGRVYLDGQSIRELSREEIVRSVGMIYQHPEKQIVFQDVEREIAFGMENLNMPIYKMKRNIMEVISLLGINHIKSKDTHEISGGERQKVAIASVLAMDPHIILFDEPISQLDPISSEELINCIKKLNRDLGKTIVLVEQRLDRCFHIADRIIFMDNGEVLCQGRPNDIPNIIEQKYHLPNLAYIFKQARENIMPVSVKEGRDLIERRNFESTERNNSGDKNTAKRQALVRKNRNGYDDNIQNQILNIKNLNFSYEKGSPILRDINLSIEKGEIMTIMGENGAGKSTLFKIISGITKKYKGTVTLSGKDINKFYGSELINSIAYLSQNPNDYFGRDTVFEEVAYTLKNIGEYNESTVESIMKDMDIENLRNYNPRDLSGGEKQRVAIACTLVTNPDILILDEPTRGMDSRAKERLGEIISNLAKDGKTVVLITHDSDFAADYTTRVVLMYKGEIVAKGTAEEILYDSLYYSPQVARCFKDKCRIIRSKDAIEALVRSRASEQGESSESKHNLKEDGYQSEKNIKEVLHKSKELKRL